MIEITRRFSFEAAHHLPKVPDAHKCRRLHGHNYVIEVSIAGAVREDGMVEDFAAVELVMEPILRLVDHRLLNEVAGLENPTAEIIAGWLAKLMTKAWRQPARVRVYETPDCWAEWRA